MLQLPAGIRQIGLVDKAQSHLALRRRAFGRLRPRRTGRDHGVEERQSQRDPHPFQDGPPGDALLRQKDELNRGKTNPIEAATIQQVNQDRQRGGGKGDDCYAYGNAPEHLFSLRSS